VATNAVQCAGGADQSTKTLSRGFTAAGAPVTVSFTAAEMATLLQTPLPATAVHVFVMDAAGKQSNYALPTAVLIGLGQFDAVDLIDATSWTPVPVFAASALPTLCEDPEVGVEPDCQTLPPPCEGGEVGATGEACIDEPGDACAPGTVGPAAPACLPECPDGSLGAGPACAPLPQELACLADASCVDQVKDALCVLAGTPGSDVEDCLAALPDTVAEALCVGLDVCAGDIDGDRVPDAADQCNGDDLDPEECPSPDLIGTVLGALPSCDAPVGVPTVAPLGAVSVCAFPEGGPVTKNIPGMVGIRIRIGGLTINL
jgi:hypothetical protein